MQEEFRHFTPIHIRFADIDRMQHVNNANYLTYIETARIKYFEDVIGSGVFWAEKGIILARAELDFLAPIELEDEVEVATRVSRMGNKSFDFEYKIFRKKEAGEEAVAAAKTVIVCYDYKNAKTIPLPEDWKDKFSKFEGWQS